MNSKTQFAAALAALAVAATVALPSGEAQAKGKGWAIGAGLIGAAVVGSAIVHSHAYGTPVYSAYEVEPVYGVPQRRCFHVDQYDHNGNYFGTRTVCRR